MIGRRGWFFLRWSKILTVYPSKETNIGDEVLLMSFILMRMGSGKYIRLESGCMEHNYL
jgi:hypothetical protein